MYVGNKTDSGNDIQRAGLTNGNLYGIAVQGLTTETRTAGASGRFVTANLGDVSSLSGAELQVASTNAGVTEFLRPEDGAWDARPGFENDFYFVTTDRVNTTSQVGASRLYRLRFDDISNPEAGGSVTMLLDGRTSGFQMLDNLCVDKFGRILMQEDVGNNAHLGKMWLYDTASQGLALIAQHDPARFLSGSADFQTVDEESSGVMDASDLLGDGWYLLDVQNHKSLGGELVESGQLLAMYVDPSVIPAPSSMGLLGLAALVAGRRRR
jgi:secreted PhoX family phosphatase